MDLIDEWKKDFKGYIDELDIPRDDYNGIMEYIDEVQSAQPETHEEHTETLACDLISRQAAIDAMGKAKWAKERLMELPSAQPVITCDGCRFVSTYDTDFPCCSCVRREKDYYAPER